MIQVAVIRILMNPNLAVICKEEHDEVEILDILQDVHTGEEDEIDITETVTLKKAELYLF